MRATARRRSGRLISYQELFIELGEELDRSAAHRNALDTAGAELIKMIRAKKIVTVIGQRDIRGGRLRLDRFPLWLSGTSAGCRRGLPFSGWHAGRA